VSEGVKCEGGEVRVSGDCEGGEGGRGWEGVRWLRWNVDSGCVSEEVCGGPGVLR